MAKSGGFHELGVKPESIAKEIGTSAKDPKPYYPSLHIGHKAGIELPAGDHEFHIKAKVGVNTRQEPGQKPERSHTLEITHIKHLAAKGGSNEPTDPSESLDNELGKIQKGKQKMGNSNQAAEQTDEEV